MQDLAFEESVAGLGGHINVSVRPDGHGYIRLCAHDPQEQLAIPCQDVPITILQMAHKRMIELDR